MNASRGGAKGDAPVQAIAFDWGGVFTEGTFDGRAVQALARLFDRREDAVAAAYYPLMEHIEIGAFDLTEFCARLTAALVVEADEAAFRQAFLAAPRERPAMYDLLALIPRQYAVAMLSNNVPELCDRVRSDPRMVRIEQFVFSNEIGARKPAAEAFAALSAALGLAPANTLFVDDNVANVAACEELGFRGILLDTPAGFARRWCEHLPELAELVTGPAWT